MNKTCDLCGDVAESFHTVFDRDQNKEIDICDGCMDVAIEMGVNHKKAEELLK